MLQSRKVPVLFFLKKITNFDPNIIFTIDIAIGGTVGCYMYYYTAYLANMKKSTDHDHVKSSPLVRWWSTSVPDESFLSGSYHPVLCTIMIVPFFQKHKKKRKTPPGGNFSALHLINDPQGKLSLCSCLMV